jgi:hypothetical protein
MVEETLVKENLDDAMIREGAALTRKLEEQGWPVVAAFWFFDRAENRWSLFFASPRVATDGPKGSYEAISQALSGLSSFFGLQFITVVSPHHELVKTFAALSHMPTVSVPTRVSRTVIDGRYIDDAYVYRAEVNPAAA